MSNVSNLDNYERGVADTLLGKLSPRMIDIMIKETSNEGQLYELLLLYRSAVKKKKGFSLKRLAKKHLRQENEALKKEREDLRKEIKRLIAKQANTHGIVISKGTDLDGPVSVCPVGHEYKFHTVEAKRLRDEGICHICISNKRMNRL